MLSIMQTSTRPGFALRDGHSEPVVLPVQFFPQRSGVMLLPERRLMGAVLADAVQIYLAETAPRDGEGRRAQADVEAWLASEDTASPFSFRNVCDALGLDHFAARAALVRRRPGTSGRTAGRRASSGGEHQRSSS